VDSGGFPGNKRKSEKGGMKNRFLFLRRLKNVYIKLINNYLTGYSSEN